jgi:ubiquinone/menaquinone biosynthesis C-methylase UbiE
MHRLVVALFLALAQPLQAQDPAALLARHPLESPERGVIARRAEIVSALELRPGQSVADIGAGTGAFMEPIARAVGPEGTYIGIDIDPDYVRMMSDRLRRLGLANARVLRSKPEDILLGAGSVDVMVVIDAYHHFAPPEPMLASMKRALKRGGYLVIVDFDRTPSSPNWIRSHVRANRATFQREIEGAGFRFDRDLAVPGLSGHFVARFVKP